MGFWSVRDNGCLWSGVLVDFGKVVAFQEWFSVGGGDDGEGKDQERELKGLRYVGRGVKRVGLVKWARVTWESLGKSF
jgi:hypothetical protein